jgi:hypothetical protein
LRQDFIITVNTYLFKYVPVKLGFIILSIIGVLRIPEEFYLYKDKKTKETRIHCTSRNQDVKTHYEVSNNNLWRKIKIYIKQILYNFGMYSGLVRDEQIPKKIRIYSYDKIYVVVIKVHHFHVV